MFPTSHHEAEPLFTLTQAASRATQSAKTAVIASFSPLSVVSTSSTPAHKSESSRFAAARRLQRETLECLQGWLAYDVWLVRITLREIRFVWHIRSWRRRACANLARYFVAARTTTRVRGKGCFVEIEVKRVGAGWRKDCFLVFLFGTLHALPADVTAFLSLVATVLLL
jgi:hypothetical protein